MGPVMTLPTMDLHAPGVADESHERLESDDFPEPLGPMTATTSPGHTSKLTSRNTVRSPYRTQTPQARSAGAVISGSQAPSAASPGSDPSPARSRRPGRPHGA